MRCVCCSSNMADADSRKNAKNHTGHHHCQVKSRSDQLTNPRETKAFLKISWKSWKFPLYVNKCILCWIELLLLLHYHVALLIRHYESCTKGISSQVLIDTLNWHLDWYHDGYSVNTMSTPDWHLEWHSINGTLDPLSSKMLVKFQLRCWWNIDRVLIKNWMRVDWGLIKGINQG